MEETEEQLRAMCNLTEEDLSLIDNCKSTKRRIELLSVRTLLKTVGINQIIHYDNRKPFLDNGYISISHSVDIAAIIWNPNRHVGIDIETISPRISRIATRAFSKEELVSANDDIEKLTILWNSKECIFKLANDEGIDFREMIKVKLPVTETFRLMNIVECLKTQCEGTIEATLLKSGRTQRFSLSAMKIENNTVVFGSI